MCGIFGYYNFSHQELDDSKLEAMGEVISYRGPDGLGYYHKNGRALGNQRLAIIDVEHGQQPFYSDDGNIIVVQNGEIFNHVELAIELEGTSFSCKTTSDTEVLLRLYEKHGIDFISKLNGMFAICIYDKNIDTMYLIRDRVGEKPLYFYKNEDIVMFGSEIKSIIAAGAPKEVDIRAIDSFISYNYVVPPLTMFSNISHVMPGTYIKIEGDSFIEEKWWDLSQVEPVIAPEENWINAIKETIDDATRIRLRSDVPFGAFLSGGVDSSTVVGYMSKNMDRNVKTFSIGFHDPKYDETPYALQASKRFESDHISERVEANLLDLWGMATYHCDQPHGDVSFMPTYKVAELAAKQVKMVLTGDGADELFAGYDKYLEFFSGEYEQLSDSEFRETYLDSISLFSNVEKSKLFSKKSHDLLEDFNCHDTAIRLFDSVPHQDRINQALYLDTNLLLSGNNLVKPDRMGMAASIENRAPFLDYRMIELAFSIPGELKIRDNETKYIFKKSVSSLIGDGLAYRKKQMFTVPIGEWLKKELKPMVEDLLMSDKAKSRGLFDELYVNGLVLGHCSGKQNYTREIRALMALELWFRTFID